MPTNNQVPLRVSYSAVQDFRECEQLYTYRNIERLQPRIRDARPELGTIIHAYLERYYNSLKHFDSFNAPPRAKCVVAHEEAMDTAINGQMKMIRGLARLSAAAGDTDNARRLLEIPKLARILCKVYFRVHGIADFEQHKVIMTEQHFEVEVKPGVVLPGVIDKVTQSRDGRYWIWEYKTTSNVPDKGSRFRDLQILLYKVALETLYGIKLGGVVWSYICTRVPHEPAMLKPKTAAQKENGHAGMSVAQIVTTRALVLRVIKRHKLDKEQYLPFLRKVTQRERTDIVPRYQLPITQVENVLLRDYVQSVELIEEYRASGRKAIRNVGPRCGWCAYEKLCMEVVTGGDEAYIRRQMFTTKKEKHGKTKDKQ